MLAQEASQPESARRPRNLLYAPVPLMNLRVSQPIWSHYFTTSQCKQGCLQERAITWAPAACAPRSNAWEPPCCLTTSTASCSAPLELRFPRDALGISPCHPGNLSVSATNRTACVLASTAERLAMSMYLCLDQGLRRMTLLRPEQNFLLYSRACIAESSRTHVNQSEQVHRPAKASNPQRTENHDE